MTESWTPLLADIPEIAGPLLSSVRKAVPTLVDLALQAPEAPTKPVAVPIAIDADPAAKLSVVGHELRRANHGPRDSLFLQFTGTAQFNTGTMTVRGDLVLDLATKAILRLRLVEPVAA